MIKVATHLSLGLNDHGWIKPKKDMDLHSKSLEWRAWWSK